MTIMKDNFAATAQSSFLGNRSAEYGPLRLSIHRHRWGVDKVILEVQVEDPSDRFFCQVFPAKPHYTFRSTGTVWHLLLPYGPTYHQVVISWHLSLPDCPKHLATNQMT